MSNYYDKIIKENLSLFPLSLASELLQIPIDEAKLVTLELQKTIERRPDFVAKVRRGNEYDILHIEFQATDASNMFTRARIYQALIWEQQGYQYDVLQYVVYLGQKKPTLMKRAPKNQVCTYKVIHIKKFSYKLFLRNPTPEVNIFAILANFGEVPEEQVVRDILTQILRLCKGDQARFLKCNNQLEILAQSRKLQSTVIKIREDMPFVYDITKDLRYLEGEKRGIGKGEQRGIVKGEKRGIAKGKRETISTYIRQTLNLQETPERIATLFGISIELARELREGVIQELEAKK